MRRVQVRVSGVVQGVGFRPYVHALATSLFLTGTVGNDGQGVLIEVEGDEPGVAAFLDRLRREAPALAVVDDVDVVEQEPRGTAAFTIVASSSAAGATTSIPPDTAVCADCLAEMRDPADRRFGYAFIACTHCGPRYTIVEGLPYDREQTTMADFPLCADCLDEYDDPTSRRFHAQPTACPACGPALDRSPAQIAELLRDGAIVAIKGVGGYHLACDAANPDAVDRLRERKGRGGKPFAVMAADLDVAESVAIVDDAARAMLTDRARPIVLLPSRGGALQESVAPGVDTLGVMLPYAPLHHLLVDADAPPLLVMTSGNRSDEPIAIDETEAQERLAEIADAFAHHNRRIHVACDDSVARAMDARLQPVRRSRGYAPLPLSLPMSAPDLIAVGGELKTTACVAHASRAWMSQHIGDTENLQTLQMLARTVATLTDLLQVTPEAIVSDSHPGYLSRRWAQEEAQRRGIAHLSVQHHHAHAASLMAEHRWPVDEPILAITFDGTGYGTDGTLWGGELLLATYARAERVGHLAPVALPGGDAATRRTLRMALAHLHAAGIPWDTDLVPVQSAQERECAIVAQMLATGTGCTPTSSIGRLFDAVAALLDVRQDVDYEGQAAIELEALATAEPPASDPRAWAPALRREGGRLVLDPGPTITAAAGALRAGISRAQAARAFHEGLALAVAEAAMLLREGTGVGVVGLTGGVFANAVLTGACRARLEAGGFAVLVHEKVPPNDGGLALGQVAVAAAGGAT